MTQSTTNGSHTLQDRITEYWDSRARGYSEATAVSLSQNQNSINLLVDEFVNPRGPLKVLDVGTGAGHAAISLAQNGHEVTGIDPSAKMLEQARHNAKTNQVCVKFQLGEADKLPFPDNQFDLTVAKDVLWCLNSPLNAYAEMLRVTKPGGHILIRDGNYYLDLFDEDYRCRKEYMELKNGVGTDLHSRTNVDHIDFNIIRNIAKELPLSHVRRPAWDTSALIGLGAIDLHVRSLENSFSVYSDIGRLMIPSTFVVCARCPEPSNDAQALGRRIKNIELPPITQKLERARIKKTTRVLQTIGDETRMTIILALRAGQLSVSQITMVTGCSQSLVSHNLRLLNESGMVTSEHRGRESIYYLTDRATIDRLIDACYVLSGRSEMNDNK